MAKLTIERTSQYTNRFRSIDIYMDNRKLGSISNGETKTFDIADGQHEFFAQADWVTSKPIGLQLDTTASKKLELGSPLKMTPVRVVFSITYLGLFLIGIFFKRQFNADYFLGLAFGVLLVLLLLEILLSKQKPAIYYMTIGRKEYIYLKEV